MLKHDAMAWVEEVEQAEQHRDKHSKVLDELQSSYKGAYYREDQVPESPAPENHAYEFISLTLPKLIFDNPAVSASSRDPRIPIEVAVAMEFAINCWIKDENLQDQLEMAIFDACFGYGVMITTVEEVEGHGEDADQLNRMMPKCRHLERHLYFRDPAATPSRKPRFEGHVVVRDKDEWLALEGVDKDAIESLTVDGEIDKLKRPIGKEGPLRNEIVAYEVWVPELNDANTENDPCCHGTILTIAVNQMTDSKSERKAAYIREPRPFYGSPKGPYTMFGFYPVSNEAYPLGPIGATAEQAEEVNVHATAVAEAASRMKNLVFVDSDQDTLEQAVKMSPDGYVIGIPGLTGKSVVETTVGGPGEKQINMLTLLRDRLDRVAGMSDAYRGNTSPDVTATADNIAYQGTTARLDYLKKKCRKCTVEMLDKVGYLMFHTHNIVMFLGPDAAEALGMSQPVFLGGTGEGEEEQSYESLRLEIEPMSMERVDEPTLKAAVLEVMGIVVQLAQEMPQMPWLNWKVLLDQLARLHHFRWLKEVINDKLFKTFMAETLAAQSHQMQTEAGLKQAELQIKAAQANQAKISQGMAYKDVPEDIKRQMEAKAGYQPSTQPLTSATHLTNLLKLHDAGNQRAHEQNMQDQQRLHETRTNEKKQVHERKQSILAGTLKAAADNLRPKRKAG